MMQVKSRKAEVTQLPLEVVLRLAIHAYNIDQAEKGSTFTASEDSDPAFLERIEVNYIRHELTTYDMDLESVAGKPGLRDLKDAIREMIYEAIAEAYPDLAVECYQQLMNRWDLC